MLNRSSNRYSAGMSTKKAIFCRLGSSEEKKASPIQSHTGISNFYTAKLKRIWSLDLDMLKNWVREKRHYIRIGRVKNLIIWRPVERSTALYMQNMLLNHLPGRNSNNSWRMVIMFKSLDTMDMITSRKFLLTFVLFLMLIWLIREGKSLTECFNDTTKRFGHELVICCLLEDEKPWVSQ